MPDADLRKQAEERRKRWSKEDDRPDPPWLKKIYTKKAKARAIRAKRQRLKEAKLKLKRRVRRARKRRNDGGGYPSPGPPKRVEDGEENLLEYDPREDA